MECIEQIGLFLRGLEEFFLRKIAQIFHNFWGYFKKHHIDYFFSKFWIVFGHFLLGPATDGCISAGRKEIFYLCGVAVQCNNCSDL